MTFLVPMALLGSLLLIVPILAHLFKPRKMKQTPFSSLRWLKETRQRLSRRIQWHQWLLFLLRAGCVLLLVLALAKPLIGTLGGGNPTDRFIVLDVSRSMAYQMPETPTPLDRAKDLAVRVARTTRPGDRTAVILVGSSPRLAAPLNADLSPAIAALQSAKPTLAEGSLSAALSVLSSSASSEASRDVELVFLTDHRPGRWRQEDIQAYLADGPRSTRVKVIDVGFATNNVWIADARLLDFGNDERWILVEVGCVGDARARTVRLTGLAGADDAREVTLKSGQLARVHFQLPANLSLQGKIAELRLDPEDALPSDDVYWLNLDTALALRVLVIEPEAPGSDGRPVGTFLHAGMEALVASKNQMLTVMRRTSASVSAADARKADVIVLAGAPDLVDATLDAIEARVRGGAGLAVFLGPRLNTSFYQQKMYRSQQPAEGLLPTIWKGGAVAGKPGVLTNARWSHSVLAPLKDPVLSDFTTTRYRAYYPLTNALAGKDTVLARFDDDVPAIVAHPLGAGRVLLFNTSANDEWSDLPRRKSFLPLLDRTLAYLSEGGRKRTFTTGDSATLPIPGAESPEGATVTTPGGAKLAPRLIVARQQSFLYVDDLNEMGIHRLELPGGKTHPFTVNAPRGDSPLASMDSKALETWWTPAPFEVISGDAAERSLEAPGQAWPVWPALVLLAGCLLVAETVYVHRLCPRAGPKAAEAVVGIMKPVGNP
ncbi:MAG: BatA domain-containing protein [Planctomycetes bacterium]|nr:BatA domain-containing protein [Planctomycetota bacterium]